MPSSSYTIKRCFFPGYKIAKKCHKLIVACSSASAYTELWKHIRWAGGPSFWRHCTSPNTLTAQLRALQTWARAQGWYGTRIWQTSQQRQQRVHSVWQGTVLDDGTPSSCHRPAAVETWAENNILSMAGIWCTFQMCHERVGPALCPQPEDVVVPRACWSTAWGLIVAGAILHIGTTVGRAGRAAPHEVNGTSTARVIPSMYNVCGMMRENGWNECKCWSYHWLGSCSQWSMKAEWSSSFTI